MSISSSAIDKKQQQKQQQQKWHAGEVMNSLAIQQVCYLQVACTWE